MLFQPQWKEWLDKQQAFVFDTIYFGINQEKKKKLKQF